MPYLPVMDTTAHPHDASRPETPAERERRLAREAEAIAEAELAAGRGVSQADANAWLDSLDTDRPLPFPSRT
jgi:hypothetical protein